MACKGIDDLRTGTTSGTPADDVDTEGAAILVGDETCGGDGRDRFMLKPTTGELAGVGRCDRWLFSSSIEFNIGGGG